MDPAHRLRYDQRAVSRQNLGQVIPAQDSTDEADDPRDLQTHPPTIALDDTFSDLSDEVYVIVDETTVAV